MNVSAALGGGELLEFWEERARLFVTQSAVYNIGRFTLQKQSFITIIDVITKQKKKKRSSVSACSRVPIRACVCCELSKYIMLT